MAEESTTAATTAATAKPDILDAVLAERAKRTVQAISNELRAVDIEASSDVSWSSGTSGLALAFACLDMPDAAEAALQHAASHEGPRVPWLFAGLAGVGLAIELLTGSEGDADDPNLAIDRALEDVLARPERVPAELISGVAGAGVYALVRKKRPLLEAVARRLANDDWTSLPAWDPLNTHAGPFTNYGLAHGMPGALAMAALLVREDVQADALRPLVLERGRMLLATRLPREQGAWFRASSDDGGHAARTAWCYGDPGVAWSLVLAGRALGDRALEDEGLAVAVHSTRRPFRATHVKDAGICHGSAGLAHLYHRLFRLYPSEPAFLDAARTWFAWTLDNAKRTENDGILVGKAGVALALTAALDPSAEGWDLPLLLGTA